MFKRLFSDLSGSKILIILLLGVGIGIGTTTLAQADGDVIFACVGPDGQLRLPDDGECRNSETPIQWNMTGPAGPEGPPGPPGEDGNLSLSNQTCPAGEFVTGFDSAGNIICSGDGSSGSSEICDYVDNDGDDQVDEDFPVNTVCVVGTGACTNAGIYICNSDGSGVECTVTPDEPSEEICDGIDNDCDGTVDEGCDCTDGETRACGSDVGVCTYGTETCTDGEWGACEGATNPSVEVCDELDNDCDGTIDEEFLSSGSITYTDLNGVSGLVKGDSCGVGACSGGTVVCSADGGLTCSTAAFAESETCDGIDNDCDGAIDEGLGDTCNP